MKYIGKDLINTKTIPPGFGAYQDTAMCSNAYYAHMPYPFFGFNNWKSEELGPLPVCLPIHKSIINRSAVWLFGKPIQFHFPANDEIEKALREAWQLNNFDQKLVPLAKTGGREGAVALKFSYDSKAKVPIRFQILSCASDVKFYYDPLDSETLLMARIQYPFQNPKNLKWYWFREEWTDEEIVSYEPLEIKDFAVSKTNPYKYTGSPVAPDIDTTIDWKIESQLPNKFKIIPITLIKNIDEDSQYGMGDMFGLNKVMDRINLAYWLMDRDNQLSIDTPTLFIDLEPKEGDGLDKPKMPGSTMDMKTVESEDGVVKSGKAQLLESNNSIREHLTKYANDLKEILFDATGSVFPRQEDVTNKGQLTQSVLIQMYQPLLEVTNEKRKSYGDGGICDFLKRVALGLKNLGIKPFSELKTIEHLASEDLTVKITWFEQFSASEDEKFAAFDRLDREVHGGYVSAEHGVERVAQIEQIKLTEEEIEERTAEVEENVRTERESLNNANAGPAGNNNSAGKTGTKLNKSNNNPRDKGRGNDPGGNAKGQTGKRRQQGRGNTVKDAT